MNDSSAEFLGTERFKINRRLGSGGMGVVYEAHDRQMNKTVALKTLTRAEPEHIYRFKREFRALADVTHPNLVSLYEFMSDGKFWFFTMELVKGTNFLEYVRPGVKVHSATASKSATLLTDLPDVHSPLDWSDIPLDEERLRSAFRQLAQGVHGLHETGKLHRDIKPSNVLVTKEGRVVILDFGLVADVEPEGLHDS